MNSITFFTFKELETAANFLAFEATPPYSVNYKNLTVSSEDIITIMELLNAEGIYEFEAPFARDEEHDPFHGRDAEADADALASAGMGTDEDYEHHSYDEGGDY